MRHNEGIAAPCNDPIFFLLLYVTVSTISTSHPCHAARGVLILKKKKKFPRYYFKKKKRERGTLTHTFSSTIFCTFH